MGEQNAKQFADTINGVDSGEGCQTVECLIEALAEEEAMLLEMQIIQQNYNYSGDQ